MKQRETEIKRMKTGRWKQRDRDRNRRRELLQLPPGREYFGGNLAISGQQRSPHGLWAGYAPHCQEVHLLSSHKPVCYVKIAFLDKDMGTPPLTSHPGHGGRSLGEVLRDRGAGGGLREAASGPSEPGTQSICAQASPSHGWGPSCGTPGEQQQPY